MGIYAEDGSIPKPVDFYEEQISLSRLDEETAEFTISVVKAKIDKIMALIHLIPIARQMEEEDPEEACRHKDPEEYWDDLVNAVKELDEVAEKAEEGLRWYGRG